MTTHKWSELKRERLSDTQRDQLDAEVELEVQSIRLRELRERAGLTQVEAATLAEMTQSALSRLERRDDSPVSSLRAYIRALGGELEIVAVLNGERFKLLGP